MGKPVRSLPDTQSHAETTTVPAQLNAKQLRRLNKQQTPPPAVTHSPKWYRNHPEKF